MGGSESRLHPDTHWMVSQPSLHCPQRVEWVSSNHLAPTCRQFLLGDGCSLKCRIWAPYELEPGYWWPRCGHFAIVAICRKDPPYVSNYKEATRAMALSTTAWIFMTRVRGKLRRALIEARPGRIVRHPYNTLIFVLRSFRRNSPRDDWRSEACRSLNKEEPLWTECWVDPDENRSAIPKAQAQVPYESP